jgi:hypothetical protein
MTEIKILEKIAENLSLDPFSEIKNMLFFYKITKKKSCQMCFMDGRMDGRMDMLKKVNQYLIHGQL